MDKKERVRLGCTGEELVWVKKGERVKKASWL